MATTKTTGMTAIIMKRTTSFVQCQQRQQQQPNKSKLHVWAAISGISKLRDSTRRWTVITKHTTMSTKIAMNFNFIQKNTSHSIPLAGQLTTSTMSTFATSATVQHPGGSDCEEWYDAMDGPTGELFQRQRSHQHQQQQQQQLSSSTTATATATATATTTVDNDDKSLLGLHLIGQSARVVRTFGPQANAQAMLVCGGEALAAHSSFDPDYRRAQDWIRHHAVGPAVLSPVLITGLTGALVEAAFPHCVPIQQSMQLHQPLIVGVSVVAHVQVTHVVPARGQQQQQQQQQHALGRSNLVIDTSPTVTETETEEHLQASEQLMQLDRRWGYHVTLQTETSRVRDGALIATGMYEVWIPDYMRM